jgi:predicted deacylase
VIWGTTPTLEGRSLSAARDLGVPAIYAEHGGGGGCDPHGVDDYLRGCLRVMRALGMIVADAGTEFAGAAGEPLVVEDPRDGSGHLQASHPAPSAGFFRPLVALGAEVRAGDLVGTVCDPLEDSVRDVRAQAAGLVLALRIEPSVRAGDALVVILERLDATAEEVRAIRLHSDGGEA